MPIDLPKAGETEEQYLEYCIPAEIEAGYPQEQAAAMCYAAYRRDKMSKIKDTSAKVMASVSYNTDFRGINLFAEADEDPCTSGYEQYGMKDLDGRQVPNCIPIKE
jgi:hypothetical protein